MSSPSSLFSSNLLPRGYGSGDELLVNKSWISVHIMEVDGLSRGYGSGDPLADIICCSILLCNLSLFSGVLCNCLSIYLFISFSLTIYL